MDLGLEGKTALVTAASKGLGFAIAHALTQEGTRVAITSRDEDRLQEAAERIDRPELTFSIPCDLADPQAVDLMLDRVLTHYGHVDILICNTGGPPTMNFMDSTREDWEGALEMMFFPALEMIRRLVPGMRQAGGGRIIFMTSSWVKQPREGGLLSTVVRSALSGLSKHLSTELASDRILVHQVMPGPTWTDRSKHIISRIAERRNLSPDKVKEDFAGELPLKRYGTPEEVAAAAVFLASEPAAFMTGTAIQVDGGQIRSTL
jgi:3-oxoacyl-[acyl-carrier protein] reductase